MRSVPPDQLAPQNKPSTKASPGLKVDALLRVDFLAQFGSLDRQQQGRAAYFVRILSRPISSGGVAPAFGREGFILADPVSFGEFTRRSAAD